MDYNIDDMKDLITDRFSFRDLRERDLLYIDKTEYIFRLVSSPSRFFFLSRPRRFGKSLFCSTLHELFEGRCELFQGLYIADDTDYGFERHPVIHLDFSELQTTSRDDFLIAFQELISGEAARNGVTISTDAHALMMKRLISRLREKAGKDTVIIIDEYDSAITAAAIAGNPDLGCMRSISDDFYKVIKAASGSIRLLFITGCVRLANLSVFSAINNLRDISMDPRFAAAFGYTDEELSAYFGEGIDGFLASHHGIARESFIREIREYYDGYRFSPDSETTVYNPVSIGEFFINGCSFMNYWIRTGSSRLAVSLSMNYLLSDSGDNPFLDADSFATFDIAQIGDGTLTNDDIKALLYFSGYLTIKSYEHPFARLGFPNQEVRRSFLSDLVARYTGRTLSDCRIWLSGLIEACMSGRPEQVIGKLTECFDAFSFELTSRDPERAYQLCFQSIFVMASLLAISEDRGAAGRSDGVIIAGSHIWIFELKVDGSADAALRQIEERRYAGKYGYLMKPGMQLHRLGISFSSRTRSIEDWKCC